MTTNKSLKEKGKEKILHLGNMLRDLLLRQPETLVDGKIAKYLGEKYSYNPYTKKDRETLFINTVKKIRKLLCLT